MVEADLFEELIEPVEAAAHAVGAAAGIALALALAPPRAPLQPGPFYFLLVLATGVAALLHTLRVHRVTGDGRQTQLEV
jgi:hypothetical protein